MSLESRATFKDLRQAVEQAELLPAVLARTTWGPRIRGRQVLNFVDNMGAADSLVRGSAPHAASMELVSALWELETALQLQTWFERVPSEGNPADAPSRGVFTALGRQLAVDDFVLPAAWARLGGIIPWRA